MKKASAARSVEKLLVQKYWTTFRAGVLGATSGDASHARSLGPASPQTVRVRWSCVRRRTSVGGVCLRKLTVVAQKLGQ